MVKTCPQMTKTEEVQSRKEYSQANKMTSSLLRMCKHDPAFPLIISAGRCMRHLHTGLRVTHIQISCTCTEAIGTEIF